MLAKFQGILFKVSKHEELPVYYLSKNGHHYGSLSLDNNRFYMSVSDHIKDVSGEALAFNFDPKDFQVLDYSIIDKDWLINMMDVKNLDVNDIAQITNTSGSTVYRWIAEEDNKEISGAGKSSLFNFFYN